jgi:hypothetical protein
VKVIVHPVPGQPDSVPQRVTLPNSVLLTITSTPAAPVLQRSLPVRSVAPTIFEVTVVPTGSL